MWLVATVLASTDTVCKVTEGSFHHLSSQVSVLGFSFTTSVSPGGSNPSTLFQGWCLLWVSWTMVLAESVYVGHFDWVSEKSGDRCRLLSAQRTMGNMHFVFLIPLLWYKPRVWEKALRSPLLILEISLSKVKEKKRPASETVSCFFSCSHFSPWGIVDASARLGKSLARMRGKQKHAD